MLGLLGTQTYVFDTKAEDNILQKQFNKQLKRIINLGSIMIQHANDQNIIN